MRSQVDKVFVAGQETNERKWKKKKKLRDTNILFHLKKFQENLAISEKFYGEKKGRGIIRQKEKTPQWTEDLNKAH